ncbi:MAG: hypothetical protein ABJA57_05105 [Ginsengibacter sp.]
MRKAFIIIFAHYLFSSCSENQVHGFGDSIIAKGQMPDITKDADGNLHLVYGIDDSVMYCISTNEGKSFSLPSLIGVIPHLAASHTRGPQIASTNKGVLVIACNSYGDIFSYNKIGADWRKGVKINDMDTTAKENLIALSANGTIAFAVWLDLRDNKKKKYLAPGQPTEVSAGPKTV